MVVFGAGILLIGMELAALFASALAANFTQGADWVPIDVRAITIFFGAFAVCQFIIANALIRLL